MNVCVFNAALNDLKVVLDVTVVDRAFHCVEAALTNVHLLPAPS